MAFIFLQFQNKFFVISKLNYCNFKICNSIFVNSMCENLKLVLCNFKIKKQ